MSWKPTFKNFKTMEKRLSFGKIKATCPDQWVVLANPTFDGDLVQDGLLLFHHPDKRMVLAFAQKAIGEYHMIKVAFTEETSTAVHRPRPMKLLEKYPALANADALEKRLSANLFATMQLEDQGVEMATIQKIVRTAIEKRGSELSQFLLDEARQTAQIA